MLHLSCGGVNLWLRNHLLPVSCYLGVMKAHAQGVYRVQFAPIWGRCKSWTLDSGLDHGLDRGLDGGLDVGPDSEPKFGPDFGPKFGPSFGLITRKMFPITGRASTFLFLKTPISILINYKYNSFHISSFILCF